MCERRFTNHAVRPKTGAIYTTPVGILRLSPNNRTAKVRVFILLQCNSTRIETKIYNYLTLRIFHASIHYYIYACAQGAQDSFAPANQ